MLFKEANRSPLPETPLERDTVLRRAFGLIKMFDALLRQDSDVLAARNNSKPSINFLFPGAGVGKPPFTLIKDGIIYRVKFECSTIAEETVFKDWRFTMDASPSLNHPSPPFRAEKIELEARYDLRLGMNRALIRCERVPVEGAREVYTNSEEAVAAIRARARSFRKPRHSNIIRSS